MSNEDIERYQNAFANSQKYGPNPLTEVKLLGDRNIRIQIVTLLSYIRNSLMNKKPIDIKVSIGKNIDNGEFEFLVNDSKTDDLIAKDFIEIN